jgi:LysR family transcriptional regulator, low CO2-responsive transcriptional regulator
MNLDYLRTYLQVVKLGSFSEAARKLKVSQPAISFQISKLERDLGVRLIDRSQKTINVTEAGKRLLEFAELVERERANLQYDMDRIRGEVTGTLVIAASTIPGEILLLPILSEFQVRHPAVSVRVEISDSLEVISRVQEGDYDIGFCGIAPERKELDFFKFAEDEIVLIVFPEHPFSQRKEVSFPELQGEPLISREDTSGTQSSLKSLLAGSGFDPGELLPSLTLGTTQAVVSAVEAGMGIGFVSNLAIDKSLALGLVKTVAVNDLKLNRDFYCVYRRKGVISRLLSEFIDFIRTKTAQS